MLRASGDVLLRIETDGRTFLSIGGAKLTTAGVDYELEPLFDVPRHPTTGFATTGGHATWQLARPNRPSVQSPWDAARDIARQAALRGATTVHAEPDLIQEWPVQRHRSVLAAAAGFEDQSDRGGKAVVPGVFAWHLGDQYSGLGAARQDAHDHSSAVIRIAHLDVGYGLDHDIFPTDRFERELSKNCTGDGRPDGDVNDQVSDGGLRNPGHGTGTIGLLAGGKFAFNDAGYHFNDVIGATLDAKIVGVRVGDSVVQIKTSSVARAIAYVSDLCKNESTRVHVLSMSMGGVASKAWADAVNLAYLNGVVLVTAAGNNYSAGLLGGLPTTSTIYPARFERVLAACGAMANASPYYGLTVGTMQGNWGPKSKAATSLAAFTPNMPWARRSERHVVDMNGAGTSVATPQIAGAAALYLQKHGASLFSTLNYPEPWMRVEAVRKALIQACNHEFNEGVLKKMGSGILRAGEALNLAPARAADLTISPVADASFPFFHSLTGLGARAGDAIDPLLELELAQLVQQWDKGANPFDDLLARADERKGGLTNAEQRELLEKLRTHPRASAYCRSALASLAGATDVPGPAINESAVSASAKPLYTSSTPFVPEMPRYRALRGYALDPSFAMSLTTRNVSETVYKVPWDPEIKPGPSDEYVQVIDVDPSSKYFYEPVNLQDPNILATQGLTPSEGTPQFHQQMVYAVARMTIDNFEKALGRRALWRPGPAPAGKNKKDDSIYVPKLRIYPHALREANAYYSPNKIALLFGYFSVRTTDDGMPKQPEQVFTCLSQDIIAHETTHALLDGMHRKYLTDSNPDVLAFHEAFADLVALFQRLTLPDLLRDQIARTRGEIRTRHSLLGELATQFGRATGSRGGLREAIGTTDDQGNWFAIIPTGNEYNASLEPHARGSVLVAAVFDAFISIYEKRTEDLVRIATEGTGVLRPGAIHPDLVTRLADEAAKAAAHVLRMCIRALDYCPPTDLTFGEYLRALITADYELVPDDDLGYRAAFVEAFRKRGITVRDVRTLSVESLLWRLAKNEPSSVSSELCGKLSYLQKAASEQAKSSKRNDLFQSQRKIRAAIHDYLVTHFESPAYGAQDAKILGLHPAASFEVHSARFALRVGPDGQLLSQAIIGLLQQDCDRRVGDTPFEGGSTVIADLTEGGIRYIIRKNVLSDVRHGEQIKYAAASGKAERATGFDDEADEPFAALHEPHEGDEIWPRKP